jgi:DNA-binding CsgD family transcriptional regulator
MGYPFAEKRQHDSPYEHSSRAPSPASSAPIDIKVAILSAQTDDISEGSAAGSDGLSSAGTPNRGKAPLRDIVDILGLGCMIALDGCLLIVFQGSPWIAPQALSSLTLAGAVARLVALIALACLSLCGIRALGRASVAAAAVISAVCGSFAAMSTGIGGEALQMASSCVSGVCTAVLCLAWCETMASLNKQRIMRVVPAASAIGILLSLVGSFASAALPGIIAALAIVAGGTLLPFGQLECCEPDGAIDSSHALDYPWLTIVMLILSGVLASILEGSIAAMNPEQTGIARVISFVVALLSLLAATLAVTIRSRDWQSRIWVPLFCLLFFDLLVCCVCTTGLLSFASGILAATTLGFAILRWLFVPLLSSHAGDPRVSACALLAAASDTSLMQILNVIAFSQSDTTLSSLYSLSGVIALVLVIVFASALVAYRGVSSYRISLSARLLTDDLLRTEEARARESSGQRSTAPGASLASGAESGAGSDSPKGQQPGASEGLSSGAAAGGTQPQRLTPTFDEALDAIAKRYELTSRELEIARLTARGNSSKHIADVLVISSSTVRFHQQNFYRKLDIHSRQEFIDLVNAVMNGTDQDGGETRGGTDGHRI